MCTVIVSDIQNNFCTQHVLQKEELLTKMHLYLTWMSYFDFLALVSVSLSILRWIFYHTWKFPQTLAFTRTLLSLCPKLYLRYLVLKQERQKIFGINILPWFFSSSISLSIMRWIFLHTCRNEKSLGGWTSKISMRYLPKIDVSQT